MKTEPNDPLHYCKRSDAPFFFRHALAEMLHFRLRFGARLLKLAIACLALTGCATTRYTTVYCLSHDQALPSEPPKVRDRLTGQADKDLTIVAGSAIRLRAYGEGLWTILEGCRDPK